MLQDEFQPKFLNENLNKLRTCVAFLRVCNCSMFCCTLLYVHSSIAIILGKRELVALLYLSSWCLVMVERLFLAVPQGCLQFVIAATRRSLSNTFPFFFSCFNRVNGHPVLELAKIIAKV